MRTLSRTSVSCRASTREASRMVSISANSSSPRLAIRSRLSICPGLSSSVSRTKLVNPRMALSGLLRSWLTLAKNSPRIRAARSRAEIARS